VRRTISQLLQRLGYHVLEAGNGEEALALWRRERERVALVLADMVMPGRLNGQELLRQLRQDKPALKCLLMSGYSQELVNEGISAPSETGFLPKPVELATLAKKIRGCLDGK
jgi:two-component system cell cycle sensor histidine kinase/response regulator CckA